MKNISFLNGSPQTQAGPWLTGFILLLCQTDEIAIALLVSLQKSPQGNMSEMFSCHTGVKSSLYLFMSSSGGSAWLVMGGSLKGWIRVQLALSE